MVNRTCTHNHASCTWYRYVKDLKAVAKFTIDSPPPWEEFPQQWRILAHGGAKSRWCFGCIAGAAAACPSSVSQDSWVALSRRCFRNSKWLKMHSSASMCFSLSLSNSRYSGCEFPAV